MNIEEAIEHCKEQAKVCSIKKCADDHLQLAKWLEELKELRELFTLTAEEVDVSEVVFNRFILDRPDLRKFIKENPKEFAIINNIIKRIKQWQDENPTNKGTEPTSD